MLQPNFENRKEVIEDNDIKQKIDALEFLLVNRFDVEIPRHIKEYVKELVYLYPKEYETLKKHCLHITKIQHFESVYLYYIQRLRKNKRKRVSRHAKINESIKQKEIVHFKPKELLTDAVTFQYKENCDAQGVTERLKGIKEWNADLSGIVIVWESKEGLKYIADGHQRLGLAKRLKDNTIRLDGILYKELDGYTPSKVRMLSAKKNIAEGTGTALDTAKIIRELGGVKNYPTDLPRNGVLYQYGMALSYLGANAFQKVVNGLVTIEQGAIIGNIIRLDYDKQSVAIDVIAKECIETLTETELMARQVLSTPIKRAEQITLFGVQEILQSYAITKVKLINGTLKELKKAKNLMRTLEDNTKQIEENGNVLNKDNNEDLKKSAETSIEIIKHQAFTFSRISDKANDLAIKIDNKEITYKEGIELFCAFCMQSNILQLMQQ